MSGDFDAELRDSMIDMADELAGSMRREELARLEMRVRTQKLKIRIRELRGRADGAEDRAASAAAQREEALQQLAQQAQAHAKAAQEHDTKIISLLAELNRLKVEALGEGPSSDTQSAPGAHAISAGLWSARAPGRTLPVADDSLLLSLSLNSSGHHNIEEQASAKARACVHRSHPRPGHNFILEPVSPQSSFLPLSSISDQENGPTNGMPHDHNAAAAVTAKEANRTLRLINKELQLHVVDLQTKLAQGKRDKALDESAITVLQHRVSMLSQDLEQQKQQRVQVEKEALALRGQAESLLNSVPRLVVHEEVVDAVCQEAYQVLLLLHRIVLVVHDPNTCML